jgi:hypothetical protein
VVVLVCRVETYKESEKLLYGTKPYVWAAFACTDGFLVHVEKTAAIFSLVLIGTALLLIAMSSINSIKDLAFPTKLDWFLRDCSSGVGEEQWRKI